MLQIEINTNMNNYISIRKVFILHNTCMLLEQRFETVETCNHANEFIFTAIAGTIADVYTSVRDGDVPAMKTVSSDSKIMHDNIMLFPNIIFII